MTLQVFDSLMFPADAVMTITPLHLVVAYIYMYLSFPRLLMVWIVKAYGPRGGEVLGMSKVAVLFFTHAQSHSLACNGAEMHLY